MACRVLEVWFWGLGARMLGFRIYESLDVRVQGSGSWGVELLALRCTLRLQSLRKALNLRLQSLRKALNLCISLFCLSTTLTPQLSTFFSQTLTFATSWTLTPAPTPNPNKADDDWQSPCQRHGGHLPGGLGCGGVRLGVRS